MFAYSYEQWHSRAAWKAQTPGAPFGGPSPLAQREELARPLDERILLEGGFSLYRDRQVLGEDAATLRMMRYRIFVLDAARFTTSGAFHGKVRLMLDHRGRYRETIEGFADAIANLDASSPRIAIVFHRFDIFARHCGPLARRVLDVIQRQSRADLVDGKRLIALLQSDSSKLQISPIGTAPVSWNERELIEPVVSSTVRVRPGVAALLPQVPERTRLRR